MDPDFTYHSQVSADELKVKHPSRKKMARRTGWAITLADVALITLLGIFLMPYLLRKGANVPWQGYEWNLKNQALSGQSFIALRIRSTKASERAHQAFSVVFYQDDRPINSAPMQATLPADGEENFVRLTIPALEGKRLKATIFLEGQQVDLANAIARDGT